MGVDTRRPPLPAPTDISSVDNGNITTDDLATDISRVTDKTSYSIPEDGSPVTISTRKHREGGISKTTHNSQTSLLIEYFEGSRSGDKVHSRPSVRVKVTPSSHKRSKTASDQLHITQTGKDKQPAYTRRISLGNQSPQQKGLEGTELSYSEESNLSSRHPIEVEVLQNVSDLSRSDITQDRRLPTTSDISSMPPDSMLEGEPLILEPTRRRSQSLEREAPKEEVIIKDTLKTPSRRRSRSLSRERITQKVMEKLTAKPAESVSMGKDIKVSTGRDRKLSRESLAEGSPRKSGRRTKGDDLGSTESSLLSSNAHRKSGETVSSRSGVSAASSINNPKLLQTVEDAIRRLILPELNALKEEQKTQKNRDKFESRGQRDSVGSYSSKDELKRRVSKSTSAPDIHKSKPKVVLNREGDDPGVVLSGDSIKGRKHRRSSRESVDSTRESHTRKSSGSRHRSKGELAAAGVIGAGLTAAALKHHDSRSDVDRKERRKHRSKSRSRSASISESVEESYRKEQIPPLPMQSVLQGSEVTRDSILSTGTERRGSVSTSGEQTPIREVSRGAVGFTSPVPRTPTRTPVALQRGLQTRHSNLSRGSLPGSAHSERSVSGSKAAAAAAAGLAAGAAFGSPYHHQEHRDFTPTREPSPVQSVASYVEGDDNLVAGRREYVGSPYSPVSSAGRQVTHQPSDVSMNSQVSTPSSKPSRTRKRPQAVTLETPSVILGESKEYGTPGREADEFFRANHEENERIRRELEDGGSPNYKRNTGSTNDSMETPLMDKITTGQGLRGVGANPEYVHTPVAVESAVASLIEQSNLSGSAQSAHSSPMKKSLISALSAQEEPVTKGLTPQPIKEHNLAERLSPSKERWSVLKEQAAKSLSSSNSYSQHNSNHSNHSNNSPQQSFERSVKEEPVMFGSNALPVADDPMPEIGHGLDDDSDVTTNPSIIQGPLGGENHGDRSHWPLDATPATKAHMSQEKDIGRFDSPKGHPLLAGAGAATAAGIAAAAAARVQKDQEHEDDRAYEPSLEDEYNARIVSQDYSDGPEAYKKAFIPQSPGYGDEGYISAAQQGAMTPEPHAQGYYDMDKSGQYTPDMAADDPFGPSTKHGRHVSINSHGMESPLYDSATGKGIDRIQSKDVIALMDHLTVRDAQRNARDTEILVTLVRQAAEMRNQFEEMKKFVAEQDAALMHNTNQKAVGIEQRILQGPRPQPLGSPRVPRRAPTDDGSEDLPTKRRNVFRRALKGLSSKSNHDMENIENMLMQLLGEVEGLKEMQIVANPALAQTNTNSHTVSLTSYENLRASGDPGYEPEGHAGTSSTPNHSGYLSNPASSSRQPMHSGYDGRRGSAHRVSTVLEGDEDLEEHEVNVLENQFENSERLLTPTQEVRRAQFQDGTPPQPSGQFTGKSQENTPRRSKHKSGGSFGFSIPKISRWSKTTASTNPDTMRNSLDQDRRPYSDHSRSNSQQDLNFYDDDDDYQVQADDRLRSTTSLNETQPPRAHSRNQLRSPSPLIPEDEYDDPKYKAHRNSLNLEHPQPRPGPTHRHQTHLESQAIGFGGVPLTPASERNFDDGLDNQHDQWGSNPSLVLGRNNNHNNRYSGDSTGRYQHGRSLSPINSDGGYSGHSASEQAATARVNLATEAPLIPPKVSVDQSAPAPASASNDRQYAGSYGGYSSPYSSGHLAPLDPIPEVRYSLETDRQALTPSPSMGAPKGMSTPTRKITGPRPMSGSGKATAANTTVRRKPVQREDDAASLKSYNSLDSETF